jgi:hypothetical protein
MDRSSSSWRGHRQLDGHLSAVGQLTDVGAALVRELESVRVRQAKLARSNRWNGKGVAPAR